LCAALENGASVEPIRICSRSIVGARSYRRGSRTKSRLKGDDSRVATEHYEPAAPISNAPGAMSHDCDVIVLGHPWSPDPSNR
jgi:hypothetical protein